MVIYLLLFFVCFCCFDKPLQHLPALGAVVHKGNIEGTANLGMCV